jgi:hypothetical protein
MIRVFFGLVLILTIENSAYAQCASGSCPAPTRTSLFSLRRAVYSQPTINYPSPTINYSQPAIRYERPPTSRIETYDEPIGRTVHIGHTHVGNEIVFHDYHSVTYERPSYRSIADNPPSSTMITINGAKYVRIQ